MHLAQLAGIRVAASVLSLLAIPLATVAAAQDMPPQQRNDLKYCAIADLFQGEAVVFPVDTLDQQARRELTTCFRVE